MKTFKQFLLLSEDEDDPFAQMGDDGAKSEFMQMLRRDCGPFLRESGGRAMLYRGILGLESAEPRMVGIDGGKRIPCFEKTVRSNREPRDTKKAVHDKVNAAMYDQFGWKPRSEGMFCFGDDYDRSDIAPYGPVHIVFPIGPIKYIWSPKVTDLWDDLLAGMSREEQDSPDHVAELIRKAGYRSTGLEEAAVMGVEIMIKCSGYYAIPAKHAGDIEFVLSSAHDRSDK